MIDHYYKILSNFSADGVPNGQPLRFGQKFYLCTLENEGGDVSFFVLCYFVDRLGRGGGHHVNNNNIEKDYQIYRIYLCFNFQIELSIYFRWFFFMLLILLDHWIKKAINDSIISVSFCRPVVEHGISSTPKEQFFSVQE